MKQFINNLLKNKMVCILLTTYVITIISLLISSFVDGVMVVTMFCFAISCILTAVKYFLDYRKANVNEDKEYLPLSQDEIKQINKNISYNKRDIVLKIIMFLVFGIAFLVFAIRMCI